MGAPRPPHAHGRLTSLVIGIEVAEREHVAARHVERVLLAVGPGDRVSHAQQLCARLFLLASCDSCHSIYL